MAQKIRRGSGPKNLAWIGGTHAVEETLRARPDDVRELWVVKEKKDAAAIHVELAQALGVRIRFVKIKDLDRVSPGRHQGVAVKVAQSVGEGLGRVLALSDQAKKGMVLLALDRIQDPHNLGAIARSAANFGVAGLILTERHSASATPAAVQTSSGALSKLEIFTVGNLAQTLERCRDAGFWIFGADAAGEPCSKQSLSTPLVLVIGSEGEGIRPLVKEYCDALIGIPTAASGVESLNASCAASVLLYEIVRQRDCCV